MKVVYRVYNSGGNFTLCFCDGVLGEQRRGKHKYVGKRAKIEAIKRYSGVLLEKSMSTNDISKYIAVHFFCNPQIWAEYRSIFHQVAGEVIFDKDGPSYEIEVESLGEFVAGSPQIIKAIVGYLRDGILNLKEPFLSINRIKSKL